MREITLSNVSLICQKVAKFRNSPKASQMLQNVAKGLAKAKVFPSLLPTMSSRALLRGRVPSAQPAPMLPPHRAVPEAISQVVLGEVRVAPDEPLHVLRLRQPEGPRARHEVEATRVVVAEPPLLTLVHHRPRAGASSRRLELTPLSESVREVSS